MAASGGTSERAASPELGFVGLNRLITGSVELRNRGRQTTVTPPVRVVTKKLIRTLSHPSDLLPGDMW